MGCVWRGSVGGGSMAALGALALALETGGCAALVPAPPLPPAPELDAARIARDVAWLADDARGGRGPGSDGLAQAAAYLGEGFRAAGLAPGGADASYLQTFDMPVSIRVARAELRLGDIAFARERDFDAFLSSGDGEISGAVVFAGYGIQAPDFDYDDYEGVDLQGRVALVLDDRPGGNEGPVVGPHGAAFLRRAHKVATARRLGAAAILIAPASADADELPGATARGSAPPTLQAASMPVLALSRDTAARIVAAAGGTSLDERQRSIDAAGRAASALLATPAIELAVAIEREHAPASNVIAILPGTDPELRHEAVVLGAHYDHLGRGEFGSLAPDRRGEIHNGADDNASGAAGLLELARALAPRPGRRTLVVAGFAGEEAGLLGSRAYVEEPPVAIDDTSAMINLDMIGRLREGRLTAFGTETSPGFASLVERAADGLPLEVVPGEGGYGPSDQTSFYAKQVPVLFFFTGTHGEYHTPDDDPGTLNAEGTADVLRVVYRVTRALLDAPERPKLVASRPPPRSSGGGGYGPYLGTIPDFAGSKEPGVLLQGVRAGSPAEAAGLRPGDRIVELDGTAIANLQEYAALLFAARPGQRVTVIVVRAGERVVTQATLGRRR